MYVLKGTFVTPGKQLEGELVVERDTITCLAVDCEDPPGATLLSITDAFIFPGFVDAHNHVAYNVLPKWTPPKLYKNRGQWQASSSYKSFKAPYAVLKDQKHLYCEMVKYGELKVLNQWNYQHSRNSARPEMFSHADTQCRKPK
jgi:hypothetical protein